jgi:hypothetical protein
MQLRGAELPRWCGGGPFRWGTRREVHALVVTKVVTQRGPWGSFELNNRNKKYMYKFIKGDESSATRIALPSFHWFAGVAGRMRSPRSRIHGGESASFFMPLTSQDYIHELQCFFFWRCSHGLKFV